MGILAPGAVVAGYRIESVVGRGGMGVVYRACDLELDRVVALKVIAPELLEDAPSRERFLKEARTAASIEHPNVIPVHAAGERDGVAYIAMRFIAGDDVRTLVRRDGPLAPGRAAHVVAQAGIGLDAIHRAGYVHRDVKPANVLVDRDGHVYVTDFGLAKHVLSRSGATRTGQWVGTLDYVAPEQIRGGRIDARTDVYALGGVLCFTLTGRVPFEREADEAKLWAQLSEPPPVPSRLREGLPRELDEVVARAMAKVPDSRYPSAGDLGRAARAAATGRRPSQPERSVARGAAAANEMSPAAEVSTLTATRPETLALARRPSRRRPALLASGVVIAVAAAIAVVAATSGSSPHRAARGGRSPTATPAAARARVVQTIPHIGLQPNGIAIAAGDLWVTSYGQRWMTRIDAATGHERRQHPHIGMGASGIATDGKRIWVAVQLAKTVVRIDADSGRVSRTLRPGGYPKRVALGLGSLWVTTTAASGGGDEVVRYSLAGHVLARLPMPRGVNAIAVGSGFVWVAERDFRDVLRIDPRTGKAVQWANLDAPASSLYSVDGHIWAMVRTADSITRLDPHHFSGTLTTAAGHRPSQAVMAGGRLFVTSNTDHTVLQVDPRTTEPAARPLPVGHNPYAIAADERAVWVTGTSDNTVTRIAYR
jgi:sugar lactone lactonase YvrE